MQGSRETPSAEGKNIKEVTARFMDACAEVQKVLKAEGADFMHNDHLGWVLTCPSNLGTGLRAGTMVKLPNVSGRDDWKALCAKMGLQARGTGGVDSANVGGTWDVSNADRIGKGEVDLVNTLIEGAAQLVKWESMYDNGKREDANVEICGKLEKEVTPLQAPAADGISWQTLQKQNAESSNAIIDYLDADAIFISVSKSQEEAILKRDAEDADKLSKGIQQSVERGSLAANPDVDPYNVIDVLGKTPDMVTQIIIDNVGEAANTGAVVVLCGLSGTGKGTTVEKLSTQLPNTLTWSNGNIFRSVTLLAATWCEQAELAEFDAVAALTPDNLKSFMGMLSFDADAMDIKISGLGLEYMVNDIKNTELKGPKVSANIPTVAQEIQGEVVAFAAGAIEHMRAAGKNVLLEGREQTVDYVPSKYRFTLTLSDTSVIGKRRAAQVIAATALEQLREVATQTQQDPLDSEVGLAVFEACAAMQ